MATAETPTHALINYLAETTPSEQSADTAKVGDVSRWEKYLVGMPTGVVVRSPDGVIRRADLFALAEVDRDEKSDRSVLDLFWNTMAWGIAGTWRNIPGLSAFVSANVEAAAASLRSAQQLSFCGQVRAAYQALNGTIKFFGPAFFTKFLYFTADRNHSPYALILDDRVRVAWRILTGEDLRSNYSSDFEHYCAVAADAGAEAGLSLDPPMSWVV